MFVIPKIWQNFAARRERALIVLDRPIDAIGALLIAHKKQDVADIWPWQPTPIFWILAPSINNRGVFAVAVIVSTGRTIN